MKSVEFSLLAWNIDQARREESHSETCWDARSPHVKALISKCNADVVALIELRDLETSSESARLFLSSPDFHQYDTVHRRYCHNKIAFSMALLVKHDRFWTGDVRVHSYLGNPNNDKIVMFVDLQCKTTLKWFTVGVTHFDLPEEIKWTSAKTLRALIGEEDKPCLVYGDYNFFDDLEGKEQRNYMLELCKDIAYPLDNANGTFVGFPHDDHKQSWEKPSRLDHVFTRNFKCTRATSPFVENYAFDNSSYETYNYPSDHLALLLQIELE